MWLERLTVLFLAWRWTPSWHRAFPAKTESPSMLYVFVFTQFRTQNRCALCWNCSRTTPMEQFPFRKRLAARRGWRQTRWIRRCRARG
ncbi:hypothetical protein DMY87_02565 [Rhizobium wuzhouense]|uniref:Secreted protein n=1 Tax=Rhizobium wuzhouense TaxID=1986026 RepID=A0ABX5NW12_9HYPH|nr:hypothetical protein DMY87_02565 [Rhizobium wuzhouense]